MNKITAVLACLCIALGIALGETYDNLQDAREQNARMEEQLKKMAIQVNELTLQYVGIVKRIQGHGGQ